MPCNHRASLAQVVHGLAMEFNFHELKTLEKLPSPSGTALAIIEALQKEGTDLEDIALLVKADPALSGKIIGLANSAAFAMTRPVASVEDAISRVGVEAVRGFALALSLIDKYSSGFCEDFDYPGFWSRSVLMGAALSCLSKRLRIIAKGEAFTLGLLSNIGQLALVTAWPEHYGVCLNAVDIMQQKKLELEQFAINHQQLTVLMLTDWGLQTAFSDAVRLLDSGDLSSSDRGEKLAALIGLADHWSRYAEADASGRLRQLGELIHLCAPLGLIDESEAQVLGEEIIEQWECWRQLLNSPKERRRLAKANSNSENADRPIEQFSKQAVEIMLLAPSFDRYWSEVKAKLQQMHYQFSQTSLGSQALQEFIETRPEIVMVDGRSIAETMRFCQLLRSLDWGRDCCLMVISEQLSERFTEQMIQAGVDDVLHWPGDLSRFPLRIQAGQRMMRLNQKLKQDHEAMEQAVKDLALANRKLVHLAHTDVLTGLPNRRYAFKRLEKAWRSFMRNGQGFCVLMIDLDNFKTVNDTLGHDVGDEVLKHFANAINESVRSSDLACRLGGEEFIVMAFDSEVETAQVLARRICQRVEQKQPFGWKAAPLTASIGVACTAEDCRDWQQLLTMADQAMYYVKSNGKNGVHLANC